MNERDAATTAIHPQMTQMNADYGKSICEICVICGFLSLFCGSIAFAQIPRITTFYPAGGKVGASVEVEVRGANLDGANLMLVHGSGVTGTVAPGEAKADETNKPVWESKCGSCHELRSPANRSMTPAQWSATVERMVKVRNAPLSADEQTKVTQYLVSAARAGRVIAQLKVAPNAEPGLVEVRVATPKGVSSPRWFEVGSLAEVTGVNGTREQAQPVTIPCVANGCFGSDGERHCYGFEAKKGDRIVFDLKSYRFNDEVQFVFSPELRLFDGSGKQVAENHGYHDLDPLIDWTCPADGKYVLEVRDLLGRSNPASVYRLTMDRAAYDTVLMPPVVPAGAKTPVKLVGSNIDGKDCAVSVDAPKEAGLIRAETPMGRHDCYASQLPIIRDAEMAGAAPSATKLPAGFTGRIAKAGTTDTFQIQGEGEYEFEGYASRLGSPLALVVALQKSDGNQVANFTGDGRMRATLEKGQTYNLTVADGAGQGAANLVYYVEIRPARPALEAVVQPDNPSLRPGVSTPVDVIVTRRDGIEGDVTVSATDLPPGVTAAPAIIPPDRDRAWLLLTAAADCKPCEQPIKIVCAAKGGGSEVKTLATPQQIYKLSNDARTRPWSECVVAVRGKPDYTVAFAEPGAIRVDPQKPTPVKVVIKRNEGFKAAVTVSLVGLPPGWTADPQSTEGSDVTLSVRTDGNDTAPFLNRDAKLSPLTATLEANSDEFVFAFGTAVITRPKTEKATK